MFFAGFCACRPAEQPKETTVTITQKTNNNETIIETIIATTPTTKAKIGENDLYINVIDTYPDHLVDDYSHMGNRYFALYDVDGNGTKELFLGAENEWLGKYFDVIYTIRNGNTVWQEQFTVSGYQAYISPSVFKNGTIRTVHNNDGALSNNYYRFENGELKFQTRLLNDLGEYFRFFAYQGTRTPITKAEYDRVQKEFEGDGQVIELDWKPLAEYGR